VKFKTHYDLRDEHAFLAPSKYHWINYDLDRLKETYKKFQATQEGTELHALASDCIKHSVKLAKSNNALNRYVNDAIGYMMTSEQILVYSVNSFGTADAISFRKNLLRIHDLKTGATPASVNQLRVYAALFCLEYHISPNEIKMELRLYQSDNVIVDIPDPEVILKIMNTIIFFDKEIEKLKEEEEEWMN